MKNRTILILCLAVLVAVSYYFLKRKKQNSIVLESSSNKTNSTLYTSLTPTSIFFTDLEDPEASLWRGIKNSEKSLSGKFSNKLSSDNEYGMTFFKKVGELPNYNSIRQIKISFNAYSDAAIHKGLVVYALSGTIKDTLYEYVESGMHIDAHKWSKQEIILNVNAEVWQPDWQIKIYPWSASKETFFVDDIKIEFYSVEARTYGRRSFSKLNFIYDFETKDSLQKENITDDVAHSGKYSLLIPSYKSSVPVMKKFGSVATDSIDWISTSVWIYPENNNPNLEIIASIETSNGQIIGRSNKVTKHMKLMKQEWHKINFRADFRGIKAGPDDIIKIFISNNGFGSVYVDDFEIIYGDLPKPTGGQPGIVADLTGNIIMRQGKNKPPFKQEYFLADENNSKLFSEIKNGEMLIPGSEFLSGKFLSAGDQDELLMINKHDWSVFKWCASENNFTRLLNDILRTDLQGKRILKGYFSNSSTQDVVLVDTVGLDAQLIHFTSAGDPCSSNHSNKSSLEIRDVKFDEVDFLHAPLAIYCGNFSGNSYSEILCINKENGAWHLYNFDQAYSDFTVKGNGELPTGEFISGIQFNNDGNYEKLLVFSQQNQQINYYLYDFSNSSVKTFEDNSFIQNFGFKSEIFSMGENSQNSELFYYNKDWRLDIKKIKIDVTGVNVESQMEFNSNDTLNPKFFEYVQIIPGKFFSHETELLVLACNCKDKNFDGLNCKEFEKAEGQLPGFMFYKFIPAK